MLLSKSDMKTLSQNTSKKNSIRYWPEDEELTIGGESIKIFNAESKKFIKHFIQCVKAFKNQDTPPSSTQSNNRYLKIRFR